MRLAIPFERYQGYTLSTYTNAEVLDVGLIMLSRHVEWHDVRNQSATE